MPEWKIKKLIHDNADKCRNKLPGTDTPAHIPLTFSPKFKCEVRKITALYFQKIKNNNNKLKIIKKKSTYNFRGNN